LQDYEDFDLANEMDELEKFLKVTPAVSTAEITLDSKSQSDGIQENGNTSSREVTLFLCFGTENLKKALLSQLAFGLYISLLYEKEFRRVKIEMTITIVMLIVCHMYVMTQYDI